MKANIISGRLVASNNDKLSVQLPTGEICEHKHNVDLTLQWLFDNMGQQVVCQIKDNCITNIQPIGERL
jgi:hypothetical protein